MQDLTANISQTVTDVAIISIAVKQPYLVLRSACLRLTLSRSNSYGQSHAHTEAIIFEIVTIILK